MVFQTKAQKKAFGRVGSYPTHPFDEPFDKHDKEPLYSGRAGTALASEIGLMKATDQLSAMEMMAVDPLRYVVIPRFLGGVIAMPLLTAVFTTIGLAGAQIAT